MTPGLLYCSVGSGLLYSNTVETEESSSGPSCLVDRYKTTRGRPLSSLSWTSFCFPVFALDIYGSYHASIVFVSRHVLRRAFALIFSAWRSHLISSGLYFSASVVISSSTSGVGVGVGVDNATRSL